MIYQTTTINILNNYDYKEAPKRKNFCGGVFLMKTVAVFFGGQSVEHEISIITGVMTANSLDKNKYKVLPVYVSTDGKWSSGEKLLEKL